MDNQDHISETLETIFWLKKFKLKILEFFDADPGSGAGMEKVRIRDLGWKKMRIWDKHPGSATLVTTVGLGFGMETNLLHQVFLSG
jgi:hypothetical protein